MKVRRVVAASLGTVVTAAGVSACDQDDSPSSRLTWHESGLPAPSGQRAMVRDATWCSGRWVVVGATADAAGDTRPAAWTSANARDWQTLRLRPGSDLYTAEEILSSVACSDGRLALFGAKPGGAHAIPRRASWAQRPDGSLAAVRASYLLYGGTQSVDVSRLVGGPKGFTIAGTRTSGAAVWQSPTGAAFRLYDGAPGLASTARLRTLAVDALPYRNGWMVAGDATEPSGRLRGVVWTGDRAGPWARTDLPGGSTLSTADRLVSTPDGPDVAGLLDQGIGLWAWRDGTWSLVSRFGGGDEKGTAASYVSGLADPGGRVAATYSDGARFRLWMDGDVPLPTEVTVSGDRTATLAAHGPHLLLLTDDDHAGKAWLTTVPPPPR